MKKYIFLLGQNSELAQEEIITIIKKNKGSIENISKLYILANISIEPKELINTLGGTIKIAEYQESINNLKNLNLLTYLKDKLRKEKKNNFGFSLYHGHHKEYQQIFKKSLELKKELKTQGYKIRLVTSKEKILSSVIVSKNKLEEKEIIIIKNNNNNYLIALTKVVQDFTKYGERDIGRPSRDTKAGMLPPKLAQIMINLGDLDKEKVLLDPFCGSGTILQEALLLGYKNIKGSDYSKKAIAASEKNITWLKKKYHLKNNLHLQKIHVKDLSKYFKKESIDLIVTEPFLGEARLLQRTKDKKVLENIKYQLQELYKEAFQEFKKILSPQGRIVFIFPIIHNLYTLDKKMREKINFKLIKPSIKSSNLSPYNNLIYSRFKQKVKREITIWQH